MIILRAQGQLGNQMFLFSAAHSALRRREWIIGVGFAELAALLEKRPERVVWIRVPHMFDQRVKRLFKLMSKASPYRDLIQKPSFNPRDIRKLGGRFRCLVFEFGLCQFGNIRPAPPISSITGKGQQGLVASRNAIANLRNAGLEPRKYGFVHIRLGDYLDFRAKGESPVLPEGWYVWAVRQLLERVPNLPIVVLSDDPVGAQSLLKASGLDVVYLDLPSRESLHIMQNAKAGVLSASTFSWWGARLASYNSDGPFIAPYFWMGFRTKQWFPSDRIISDFLEYEAVPLR